jgi:hypothetical protein
VTRRGAPLSVLRCRWAVRIGPYTRAVLRTSRENASNLRLVGGEGGIRTLGTGYPVRQISNLVPSTTRPPLRGPKMAPGAKYLRAHHLTGNLDPPAGRGAGRARIARSFDPRVRPDMSPLGDISSDFAARCKICNSMGLDKHHRQRRGAIRDREATRRRILGAFASIPAGSTCTPTRRATWVGWIRSAGEMRISLGCAVENLCLEQGLVRRPGRYSLLSALSGAASSGSGSSSLR